MRAAAGCGDDDDDSDDAATDTPGAAENGGDTGVELTMWTRSARHPHHIDGWLPAAQLHLDPTDLTHITTATPAPIDPAPACPSTCRRRYRGSYPRFLRESPAGTPMSHRPPTPVT